MTNDIENTITWYRSILTSRAKSVQGCPTGKLYTRKSTSRSSSTLKYAKDCYILYMFINGDSSGIDEVFRKDDSKSVSDQSTVPNCNVIELRATLQSALERISELERLETENQKTIKHMKTENNKLKTDLENVNDILSRHCVANERKFIQYDANHKLFNQQTKAIGEFNFDSYTTSVQRIGAEIERFNKLQASLQKQVNELKLSTQKSYAEKVSTETPARTSNQPSLKQVNSIPNRSNQQTKINIPVCSPVTDLPSEVNKSTNGNISPLSTPKSYTNTHLDSHKDNGLREIDKQLNTTYKIPVRLDGVTENIDTSPADSDENFFTGVKRKRTARYYLSGINPKSTRSGILAYLEKENVHVTYLRLFNPKHSAQRVSAKLNVVENCADYVEAHNFWPDGVQCRKWLSNYEWNHRFSNETENEQHHE
ncbi:unnamed protein product [Mytilus edulis]|uniref:Uncharacterized protein n=1 Tax=Mytilus edulis TaxID=6550 RepID=A0A8S3V3L8_MYTED|nr:unnamed protein product [Mytilus edulis]